MTKPSPALLPLPQRMTTGPSTPSRSSTSTHARPAFSIRTRLEIPYSLIATRSIWRHCSQLRVIIGMLDINVYNALPSYFWRMSPEQDLNESRRPHRIVGGTSVQGAADSFNGRTILRNSPSRNGDCHAERRCNRTFSGQWLSFG